MDKKLLKARFKRQEAKINQILNDWNFIPYSPDDEYDCLTHKIIILMNKGSDLETLTLFIEYDLVHHFGITEPEAKISETANRIYNWWIGQ